MARFHPLEVVDVRRDTRDAVVVTLRPRPEDAAAFDYVQGQYLTFRRIFEGQELRRSYSICTGKDEGCLKVGIRRIDGGVFSTFANDHLKPGDMLEAMPPMGRFHVPLDPAAARHYLAFAGGSGITPLLSIIKTTLSREPLSRFTLVYANRQIGSIMFREEIDDLKDLHLSRFSVIHVLETDTQEIDLFSGRIDSAKMDLLFARWIDPASVDVAFICGPEPMMLTIAASLRQHGLSDAQIKFELFSAAQPGRLPQTGDTAADRAATGAVFATVTLDGTTRSFTMAGRGESLLEAALAAGIGAPHSCKSGICSTCRAKILKGEAEMAVNYGLEDYEVRAGYVLACQCRPLGDRIAVSFDL